MGREGDDKEGQACRKRGGGGILSCLRADFRDTKHVDDFILCMHKDEDDAQASQLPRSVRAFPLVRARRYSPRITRFV
jgi:hypothetical protein